MRLSLSRSRTGFSLIEAAIVLGIIGLVIGGIWAASSAVSRNYKAGEAAKLTGQIYQNLRQLYAGQTTPGFIIYNGTLLRTVTPSDYNLDSTQNYVIGPFNERIQVTNIGGGSLMFGITADQQYCVSMGPRYASQFKKDLRGGATVVAADGTPITSPNDARTACAVGPPYGVGIELNFP